MEIEFRKAKPEEAECLSDLAIESKGHWGYAQEQLDIWRKDLRVEREYIEKHTVRTIWLNSDRIGFFAIKKEEEITLDHFWLLSRAIGRGIGKVVFQEIEKTCIALGIEEFVIVSDPNAEGFYLHQGAQQIGEVESTPQNRMLPKLLYRVKESIQCQSSQANDSKQAKLNR